MAPYSMDLRSRVIADREGGMESLEQVDLYECLRITDAGLPFLVRLPRLREVHLDGLPAVTLEGTGVFRPGVHVYYSA